jgi:hypothetical protein
MVVREKTMKLIQSVILLKPCIALMADGLHLAQNKDFQQDPLIFFFKPMELIVL